MTGPEHYREAERCLALAEDQARGGHDHSEAMALANAQVHATLAAAAATAEAFTPFDRKNQVWLKVLR